MRYNVLDIARYIINYSNEKEYLISNLKLQKLLYFVQAYYLGLSEEHEPCFDEEFEAWDFGPVVPEVYQEYRQYGGGNIPKIEEYIEYNSNIFDVRLVRYNEKRIESEDRKKIRQVVEVFSDYSATELVELTHRQDPWKKAYRPGENRIITKKSIEEYFSEK